MAYKRLFPWLALVLFLGIFGIVSLACDLPYKVNFGSTATPTAAPAEPVKAATAASKAAACLLPDLVGLDQKTAESALNVLGLTAEKQVEMSLKIPAGAITMQEPAAGARLDPCQGKVSLWVSGGAGASDPIVTPTIKPSAAASPTPAPPNPTAGPKLANPAAFDTLYSYFFPPANNGFGIWEVQPGAGASVIAKDGKLNVLGRVEAYAAEASYNQLHSKTRILLSGGVYGLGLKEFTLIFNRTKDSKKYMTLGCADQAQGAVLWLVCDLYAGANGKETLLPNTHAAMCTDKCDLELELTETSVVVYANAAPKIVLQNNLSSIEGTIGLRIDNPSTTPYSLDAVVVYAVPPKNEAFGVTQYREDFGGDWAVGKQDSEFALIERSNADWAYRWTITAKQSTLTHSFLTNIVVPDNFRLFVNVKKASGPADAAYGATFRCLDSKNFYYFAVRDEGTIAIYANENGKWVELLKKTKVSGIKPGEENRLGIEGSGGQYTFSINEKQVAKLSDTRFKGGGLGVVVELGQAGQAAQVDFTGVSLERFQP